MKLHAAIAARVRRSTVRPLSRDKQDMLLLLGACVLVLLPHAAHLPGWVMPACILLLGWRGWITFSGKRLPPRYLLLPVAGLAVGGVYLSYHTLMGREAGVAMLALLLALKLLEMRAKRDLFVALYLSFFLILAGFFYSQSIGTAVLTIIAVIAILTTQLSFQYAGAVPPLRRRLRMSATIVGLALPLTLVMFLFFPRIQGPLWGMPSDAYAGHTGLSNTMSPGNIAHLAQSDEIAFRAWFSDPLPPQRALYWRGIVLDRYDGRTWSAAPNEPGNRQALSVLLRGPAVHYQVTLEPSGQHWLFALDVPQQLPALPDNRVSVSPALELRAAQPINQRVRYDAVSRTGYVLQPGLATGALARWLELPPGYDPRARAFAVQMRGNAGSEDAAIAALLHYFHDHDFRYTLDPPPLGHDAIDDFLFSTRAGFCEHYAGAFVFLMRAMHIPARVVTGYQGGEINPVDGFLTVRQSDAHAWAEVWLGRRGWVRIDPTAAVAPERVERNIGSLLPQPVLGGLITLEPSPGGWLSGWHRLRQDWEAVGNAWNQWVLNYTPDRQKAFVKSLGFDHVDARTLSGLMLVLGSLALAAVVLPLLANQHRLDPVDAMYAALCRRLADHGLARAPHEGPRAYRARVDGAGSPLAPEKRQAAARFLQLYETIRYGRAGDAPPDAVAKLKNLLSECR